MMQARHASANVRGTRLFRRHVEAASASSFVPPWSETSGLLEPPLPFSVSIAGGGIGGLTAALAFSRAGHSVNVYEQAWTLRETGAGIQLSPNAMHVLCSLQLGPQIRRVASEPLFAAICHYRSGSTFFSPTLKPHCERRYGAPYLHVHRADLHSILVDSVADVGARLHTGARAEGYELERGRASLRLFGGASPAADLVIGADGLHSRVREQMLGAEAPRFTGHVAWRGIVKADRLEPCLVKPGATVWIGPGRHVVTYLLRGGELVNFAAFDENRRWTDESWTARGDPDELRSMFRGWHPEVGQVVDQIEEPFKWALFDRDELPRWSEGPVTLLGDACHPTLPYMAQGAALAIEDAIVLERLVTRGDIEKALIDYERQRKSRATLLQGMARANGRTFHMTGTADWLRLSVLKTLNMLPPSLK